MVVAIDAICDAFSYVRRESHSQQTACISDQSLNGYYFVA